MTKNIIKLDENQKFIRKQTAREYLKNCTLLNESYDLLTCYGFYTMDLNEPECYDCEVIENSPNARKNLLKLIYS